MRPTFLLATLVLLAGCDALSGSEPKFARAPADLVGSPFTIKMPEVVRRGEPVSITVVTVGDACTKKDDMDVSFVDGRGGDAGSLEMRPYNLTLEGRDRKECEVDSDFIEHTATVTFPERGYIYVRAFGEHRVYVTDGTVRIQPQESNFFVAVQ